MVATQTRSTSHSANGRATEALGGLLGAVDPAVAEAISVLMAAGYTVLPPSDHIERPRLSAREQQVAALLLEGAPNKVIARTLDISVHTAKFHVTAVLEKVGARNRADAVAIILREGLITL